jgi:sulfonate transport system substrate-binding protein
MKKRLLWQWIVVPPFTGLELPVFALVAAALVMLAACGGGGKEKRSAGNPIVINVGDLPSYPLVKVAEVKGFFKEEFEEDGIMVNINNFPSGPPEIEALAANSLDFALLGAQPAVQGIANGVGIQIVSGLVDGTNGNGIIVRTDTGINEITGLKGKKVAVPVGTTAHLTLIRALEKHGLSMEDIEAVNLGAGDIPAAILSASVNAASTFEPGLSSAVGAGGGTVKKLTTAAGYVRLLSVIVVRNDFVNTHPDVVIRFLKVIKRAAVWYNENFEESLDILAASVSIDKEILREPTLSMPPLLALDSADKASILEVARYLKESGVIIEEPLDAHIFNDSYAREAGIYDGGEGY